MYVHTHVGMILVRLSHKKDADVHMCASSGDVVWTNSLLSFVCVCHAPMNPFCVKSIDHSVPMFVCLGTAMRPFVL